MFFFLNRQQSNACAGRKKNTCFFFGNARPTSNARAHLKQRKKTEKNKCFVFTGYQYKCGSASFKIPAVIQSLQINDQLGARTKGIELLWNY